MASTLNEVVLNGNLKTKDAVSNVAASDKEHKDCPLRNVHLNGNKYKRKIPLQMKINTISNINTI